MGNYTGIFTKQGLKSVFKFKCGLFLVMFVVSISVSTNLFSADKNSLTPIGVVNNQLEKNLRAPLRRVEHIIDLVRSKALNANSDSGVTQQARLDFKWAFTAEGVSFLKPVISESGNVHVATTDIDVTVALDELEEKGEEAVTIGEINSNLYALKPNPINPRGKDEWMFNTDGTILFPPVISDDEKVFVESLVVTNEVVGSSTVTGFSVNVFAVKDGVNVWSNSVEFDNSIPLSSPVVAQNTVLMTTLKSPDFSDFNISDLSGEISAFDSATGNTKWTFNPANTGMDTEDGEGEEQNSLPKFLFAPPVVDGNTVFVNTISATSIDDIKAFLENSIEGVDELFTTIVVDTAPDFLAALLVGGDLNEVIDPVEDDIEVIITEIIDDLVEELSNLGTLFALNLADGSVKWNSKFQGVSISSPVIANSGIVTVGSSNLKLDDTNADVNIGIALDEDNGKLTFDVSVQIEIAGVTFGFKKVLEIDLLALQDDPTNLEGIVTSPPLETDTPELDELIIEVDGRVSGFNVADGTKAWETTVDSPVLLKPVISNEMDQVIVGGTTFSVERTDSSVDIGGFASKIYAVNGLNGNLDWESDPFAGVIGLPPLDLILGDPILLSTDGSVFFSFFDVENDDPSSSVLKVWAVSQGGSMKWSSPFAPENLGTSAPVIDPETGKVFLSLSQIDIPDPDGDVPPEDGETPNLRDLKPDLKGLVIGLDPLSGAVDKSVEVEGFVISSPAIDPRGGTAFISTIDFEINRDPISLDLLSFVQAVKVR